MPLEPSTLPLPLRATVLPTTTLAAVGDTTAVGAVPVDNAAAAVTAAPASSMPAPQVLVVQMHSSCGALALVITLPFESSFSAKGTVQTAGWGVGGVVSGTSTTVGNGRAEDFRMLITWAFVRLGAAASIRLTVPVTSGVAKLVPAL